MEFTITVDIETDHYREEIEDLVSEALEDEGIEVLNFRISQEKGGRSHDRNSEDWR